MKRLTVPVIEQLAEGVPQGGNAGTQAIWFRMKVRIALDGEGIAIIKNAWNKFPVSGSHS